MTHEAVNIITHFLWMVLSIPATIILWNASRGNRPKQWSMLIYGAALFSCATASTTYHTIRGLYLDDRLPPETVQRFAMYDHMGIYLLIAGTCTPIVFNLMHGRSRDHILRAVWGAALLGVVARAIEDDHASWFSTLTYLVMGWGLACCYPGLARSLPPRKLRLIWIGGMLYTTGAVMHAVGWPTIWPAVLGPDVLGPHQMLHLFVIAGWATHFWFLLHYVVPYQDPLVAPTPALVPPLVVQAAR